MCGLGLAVEECALSLQTPPWTLGAVLEDCGNFEVAGKLALVSLGTVLKVTARPRFRELSAQ